MKRMVLLAGLGVLSVLALAGCACPANNTKSGWRFEYISPPMITMQTPVLVQAGPGTLAAHPMGIAAGPVVQGQHALAPAEFVPPCSGPDRRAPVPPARMDKALPAPAPCAE